jgi:hypothetical protein
MSNAALGGKYDDYANFSMNELMQHIGVYFLHALTQLPGKYYTLGMDNLYNSTKLCRLAYGMPQKVMVHGVRNCDKEV